MEKVDKTELDNLKSEARINEILRTKNITQKQYSFFVENLGNVKNMLIEFFLKN